MPRARKTVQISITIDKDLDELLDELTDNSEIPKSRIINDIVRERLIMSDFFNATEH